MSASGFSQIDLSRLAPPAVVEALDFESILGAMLSDLRTRDPAFSAITEADPAYKILEVAAYRELLIRQRINDASRSVMLAYATGSDLDHIAANYGVSRLIISPANSRTVPPTPAVMETDEALRARTALSLEGHTTAGSRASYVFHALSASGDVRDVGVASLEPGTVNVRVLSRSETGRASAETLAAVRDALNAEDVRPLCDTVDVQSAEIAEYRIAAVLTVFSGAGQAEVKAAAEASARAYANEQKRLGRDITRSGVFAALHGAGVQNVTLMEPAQDIVNDWKQAPHCAEIRVSVGGIGD